MAGSAPPVSVVSGTGAELRSVIPMAKQATKVLPGHELTGPLAVVARKAFGGKCMTWQRGLTTLSPGGSFTFTGTKSHNVHLRHPDLVTATVTTIGKLAGPTRAAHGPASISPIRPKTAAHAARLELSNPDNSRGPCEGISIAGAAARLPAAPGV